MREVIYTDKDGYRHRVFVRDTDSDNSAEFGIPSDPPDVNDIDWDYMKREIHNALVDAGLFTWNDINQSSVGLSIICSVIKKQMSGLYHEKARASKTSEYSHLLGG
jgi:hypothetical protein